LCSPRRIGSHLPDDLAEADGGAGCEDEPVGGAVDESGAVEGIGDVYRPTYFARKLRDRPRSLLISVKE
jgi:hypothetical protein